MIGEKIKEVLKQYTGEKIDFPEFYIRTDKSEYTILSQAIEEKELESALPEPCFGCIGKTIIAIRIDKDSGTIVILLEDFSAIVVYVNHYFDVDGPDVGRFIRWDSKYETLEWWDEYLKMEKISGDENNILAFKTIQPNGSIHHSPQSKLVPVHSWSEKLIMLTYGFGSLAISGLFSEINKQIIPVWVALPIGLVPLLAMMLTKAFKFSNYLVSRIHLFASIWFILGLLSAIISVWTINLRAPQALIIYIFFSIAGLIPSVIIISQLLKGNNFSEKARVLKTRNKQPSFNIPLNIFKIISPTKETLEYNYNYSAKEMVIVAIFFMGVAIITGFIGIVIEKRMFSLLCFLSLISGFVSIFMIILIVFGMTKPFYFIKLTDNELSATRWNFFKHEIITVKYYEITKIEVQNSYQFRYLHIYTNLGNIMVPEIKIGHEYFEALIEALNDRVPKYKGKSIL